MTTAEKGSIVLPSMTTPLLMVAGTPDSPDYVPMVRIDDPIAVWHRDHHWVINGLTAVASPRPVPGPSWSVEGADLMIYVGHTMRDGIDAQRDGNDAHADEWAEVLDLIRSDLYDAIRDEHVITSW